MWIRSRDKTILKDITDFRILSSDNNVEQFVNNYLHDNNKAAIVTLENPTNKEFTLLGEYATKERAIQVLDEIQNNLSDACSVEYKGIEGMLHGEFVYQMPAK